MIAWPKILGGVLVLAAITWTVLELRADGARSVTSAIERQNNAAAHSAGDARSDYDLCLDRGGVWDFAASKCRRSAAGRWN
ncbi:MULTISPECIES: hypothetical protein [unclassified Ensifer]|uniref:hypothetical protein n=1 Tax=unclassified Ensifer TaxID=2633371 RepID=UPI00070F3EC0|nr:MULTISPECIES: hypothetical protein [unclassified Ensifer]KQW62848.1 hypothetical protein ASD02_01620 [Ensifer sp. Root1252]KRC83669.1 hypothetical protein ASE32_01610 [Ensifer sp. Root231]KRD04022.1 hypothetical protein ASE47_00270 [Ensifer sp. Root258]